MESGLIGIKGEKMKKLILLTSLFAGCITQPKPDPKPEPPKPPEKTGIVFLVGTGARCSYYMASLRYWEREGHEVRCAPTNNTANGDACILEINKLRTQFPGIRVGISGHSQGGGGSFICAYKAEQRWNDTFPVVAIEPAHGFKFVGSFASIYRNIKSPSFQWYGTLDATVAKAWVASGFRLLPSEKYMYGAVGARHIMLPINWISESVHFFNWKLKGDEAAKQRFLDLPKSARWENP